MKNKKNLLGISFLTIALALSTSMYSFSSKTSTVNNEASIEEAINFNVPPARNLKATNVTGNSAVLTWEGDDDQVYYYSAKVENYSTGETVTSSGQIYTNSGNVFRVDGFLEPNTQYKFSVLAYAFGDFASEEASIMFTTSGVADPEPDPDNICDGVENYDPFRGYRSGERVVFNNHLWRKLPANYGWMPIGPCGANSTLSKSEEAALQAPGKATKVLAFPNPVGNTLNVVYNTNEGVKYSISDMTGKTVAEGAYESELNVSELNGGIYILNVIGKGETISTTFVKE